MEWLVVAFVNFIIWIDKQFQKPLYRVVPDLDRLLHNPAETLAAGPITIGPKKRYASAIALGLFLALILTCGSLFWIERIPGGVPPLARLLFILMILGLPLALILMMLRILRGGRLTLTADGVELLYRGLVVHCPWALFNAVGQPFSPGYRRIHVPVAPAAVPFVEVRRHDTVIAQGLRVRTRQFWFDSAAGAVLKSLYEVKSKEIGELLLSLGYLLGTSLPKDAEAALHPHLEEMTVTEPAIRGKDGWVTVQLTRLAFPPLCCSCGDPTRSTRKFRGKTALRDDHVFIMVPTCDSCQAARLSLWRRSLFWGTFLGFASPLFLGFVGSLFFRTPVFFGLGLFLSFFGALFGLWLGNVIGRRRSRPVQIKRYSPHKGTVAIRFRRAEYTRDMFQAMQVPQEQEG